MSTPRVDLFEERTTEYRFMFHNMIMSNDTDSSQNDMYHFVFLNE